MDSRTINFNERRAQMTGPSSTAARLRSSTSAASSFRSAPAASASSYGGITRGRTAPSFAPRPAVTSYTPPRRGIAGIFGGMAEGLQGFISRVSGKAFAACVVVAVVALCVVMLYDPCRNYYVAKRSNEYLSSQLTTITEQNSRVEQQITALQTQEGIEDEARRRGYIEVGSNAVNVTGLPEEDTEVVGGGLLTVQETEELPWLTKALDSLFQYTPPEA